MTGVLQSDARVAMGALFALVIGFLVAVGSLQAVLNGETATFARYLGIALLLSAFSVGFYRKWGPTEE